MSGERHHTVIGANIGTVSRIYIQADNLPCAAPPKTAAVHRRINDQPGFAMGVERQKPFDEFGILFSVPDRVERAVMPRRHLVRGKERALL